MDTYLLVFSASYAGLLPPINTSAGTGIVPARASTGDDTPPPASENTAYDTYTDEYTDTY